MRLKIRSITTEQITWRIELYEPSPTLADLQLALAKHLNISNPDDIVLSLNKKDPLPTPTTPTHTLSALGLCNGDLLWLLAPLSHIPLPADHHHLLHSIPGHLIRLITAHPDIFSSPPNTSIATLCFAIVHAAMLETGFVPTTVFHHLTPTIVKCDYTLAKRNTPPKPQHITITMSIMHDAVLYTATDHRTSSWRTTIQPTSRIVTPCTINTSAVSASAPTLAIIDGVDVTAGQGIRFFSTYQINPFSSAFRQHVWNVLKDRIALPSFKVACVAAGLPNLPPELPTLPAEVKFTIIRHLDALDVAALGSACVEMRHVTSTDEVWKPLFERDFPNAATPHAVTTRGYKWVYGVTYAEKKREQQQRRQRRFLMPLGGGYFGGRPPFYPPPPLHGGPRITGGDYDRFPFLPGGGGGGDGSSFPGGGHFSGGGFGGRRYY